MQFFARIGPVDVALCVGNVPVHRHVEAIDEFAHADQTAPEGRTHRDATRDIVESLRMGERQAAGSGPDEGRRRPPSVGMALSMRTTAMAAAVAKESVLRTRLRAEEPSRSSASCSPSCSGLVAPASRAVSVSRAAKAFL